MENSKGIIFSYGSLVDLGNAPWEKDMQMSSPPE